MLTHTVAHTTSANTNSLHELHGALSNYNYNYKYESPCFIETRESFKVLVIDLGTFS